MSKTFFRPKVSSTKVTNWVHPSFDGFSETTSISTITATSLSVNNASLRRKKVPSTLESSRNPASKGGNLSSSKQICGLDNSKEYLSENEPWVDKYKPETQHELAVHKKKIEEVETWLKAEVLERQPKQGGSILLITGPPGCGKTTTIKILAKEHGIQVQEWINPVLPEFQKDDFKEILNPESSFHIFPYQSQIAVFKEFLLRATKYNQLQMLGDDLRTDKKIILVEDLPNQFYRDSHTLHEVLRKYVQIGRCPLIFIISDSLSGDNSQRLLFPKEVQEECAISNISFNPVAPTIMMKFLNRIVAVEANKNGGKIVVPDKTSLEFLCQGCSGDIRSAINSLQFSSSTGKNNLRPRKKGLSSLKSDAVLSKSKRRQKTDRIFENQEVQAIGGKDVSLFLFRALGKILYCKRAPVTEVDSPRLPSHLSEYDRDTLLVQPEEVVEMSHMPGELFNLYLHQNYVDFFTEVDDLVRASEFLSFADILSGDWSTRCSLREYSTSIATRGVIHSNKARGFAHCQGGGSSFRPLHKPQWFLINKKYRENCLAAKALFSDFCLPALCLQTQLLPYLALLTIPMRNQAQISFIQDIGRLPLKRHFGRLKMEALTDRENGMIEADSGDEAQLTGGQSAEEALGEPIQSAEPETWSLPLSQNSGNELPASQPQPFSISQKQFRVTGKTKYTQSSQQQKRMQFFLASFLLLPFLLVCLVESLLKLFIPKKRKSVTGEIVLITGAGHGIGRQTAYEFAKLKCKLVLWDINKHGLEETATECRRLGAKAHTFVVDCSNREDIYSSAKKVKAEVGDVSILVNNAGVVYTSDLSATQDPQIEKTFEVNVLAHFWTTKAFLPEMMKNNHGHIVTVASAAGHIGVPFLLAYCSSKFAAVGFHKALTEELSALERTGVKTTCLCPNFINTGFIKNPSTSLGPTLEPEEVVNKLIDGILTEQEMIFVPSSLNFLSLMEKVLPERFKAILKRKIDIRFDAVIGYKMKGK